MTKAKFLPRDDADITRLVTHYPLAWIVSRDHPGDATPLPLRPERVDDGRLATLTGHYARSNPQVASLQADPRATLLFMGANGYVSPSWFSDHTQAPTWNYACVNFDARIEFLDDPVELDRIVRDLVEALEADRPQRWRVEEMHERYARLLQHIIPFRAHIVATYAKFKLGQDEGDDTYSEIIDGLRQAGNVALVELMDAANPHR